MTVSYWDATFSRSHLFGLTEREDQSLRWAARGYTTKEASQLLGISARTIEIHRSRVLDKMRARNMSHAVAIGFASGLLSARDLNPCDEHYAATPEENHHEPV